MKVALVYDRVNKWGGAERVLLALHKIFPKAPLYTSVYARKKALWAEDFDVRTSFLQLFPFAAYFHEWYALLMPFAFESFNFDDYDLVISVTSEAAKGIITKSKTRHICYCLTPTRYLWSGYEDYFNKGLFKVLSGPAVGYLRYWDKKAAVRPDKYLVISKEVQKRVKKYYGVDSEILYPPVYFKNKTVSKKRIKEPYFLIVSRLIAYKKIDIAINACKSLGLTLKIAGTGSHEKYLKSLKTSRIHFLGQVSDKNLIYYYKNCQALIVTANEDFGLASLEAQMMGKPVIAFKKGGALEVIQEGKTGEFFDRQTPKALSYVLKNFDVRKYNSKVLRANALKFSFKNFKKSILKHI